MRCGLRGWQSVALLAAALMLGSCASTEKTAWVELMSEHIGAGPMIQITGMVTLSDLEGGSYLIRNAEGKNYNPTNLPQALRADGLAVEATAQRRDDLVSIEMVGPLVDLLRIRTRPDSTATVSGTVDHHERAALPLDAVVEVQLLDVARQDAPATIVATASVATHDHQVPIPFTLTYNPVNIVEKHIYAVRAEIRSEGALMFTTPSRYPVSTNGNPSRADLILVRVGGTKMRTVDLLGTTWILEDRAGAGVVDRAQATLTFAQGGAVSGNASCNAFRGTAGVAAQSLTLSPLATTRKMCAEAVMHQETLYMEALRGADRFEVEGEFLYIHVANRSRPLRFISARVQ